MLIKAKMQNGITTWSASGKPQWTKKSKITSMESFPHNFGYTNSLNSSDVQQE